MHYNFQHMARITDKQRAEKLREKQKQLEAQIAAIEARRRTKERKFLTRQKIIIGGAVVGESLRDNTFRAELTKLLERIVVREPDRVVIKEFLAVEP